MDQKLLLLINQKWTSPALDRLMALMSSFDAWVPIFVLIILAFLVWGGFRGRACVLTVALVLAINDGIVAHSLKIAAHRLRPHEEISGVRQVDLAKAKPRIFALAKPLKITPSTRVIDSGQGRSFPSGHAIDTTSVAVLLTLFYPRRGWLAFLIPLLVGYSRVYVGSHWPSDVIASYFIGTGATLLLAILGELAWRKFAGRLLPGLQQQHPTLFAVS